MCSKKLNFCRSTHKFVVDFRSTTTFYGGSTLVHVLTVSFSQHALGGAFVGGEGAHCGIGAHTMINSPCSLDE